MTASDSLSSQQFYLQLRAHAKAFANEGSYLLGRSARPVSELSQPSCASGRCVEASHAYQDALDTAGYKNHDTEHQDLGPDEDPETAGHAYTYVKSPTGKEYAVDFTARQLDSKQPFPVVRAFNKHYSWVNKYHD